VGDIKLFKISEGNATELSGTSIALEKSLQLLIEKNLESLLGVRFLASEYSTGPRHGGRIDSLGLDENNCPIIIEYKRTTNENVINQGLFYLDWLMDHRAEFQLLVSKNLGIKISEEIDWSAPRLICIAGGYTKYDVHSVKQMNRNIELIRYRNFGNELLLLEQENAVSADVTHNVKAQENQPSDYKTISETIKTLDGSIADLFEEIKCYLLAMGDDVQEKTLKYYIAFKRIKNFACIEVVPTKQTIIAHVKVDPESVELVEGFTRDMRNIGHYGTGDLEINIQSKEDFEKAKPLFQKSYDVS
jgi:predicted transport protein